MSTPHVCSTADIIAGEWLLSSNNKRDFLLWSHFLLKHVRPHSASFQLIQKHRFVSISTTLNLNLQNGRRRTINWGATACGQLTSWCRVESWSWIEDSRSRRERSSFHKSNTLSASLLTIFQDSEVDRSSKAAPLPKGDFDNNADIAHGDGNAAGNLTGDGKGPLDPDESVPKKKQDLWSKSVVTRTCSTRSGGYLDKSVEWSLDTVILIFETYMFLLWADVIDW